MKSKQKFEAISYSVVMQRRVVRGTMGHQGNMGHFFFY